MNLSSCDKILLSDWSLLSDLFKSNRSVVPQAEMTKNFPDDLKKTPWPYSCNKSRTFM